MNSFVADDLTNMRAGLLKLHDEAAVFVQSYGCTPAAGSQALTEHATYGRPESILTAFSLGTQLIEFGAEHLTAFVKIVTEPVEVIACWTCVRSMLESCALCAWLLDPAIDGHTRAGRQFALRYEGMEQQLKLGRALQKPAAEIAVAVDRIVEVEQHAVALGFSLLRDRRSNRIGIGQQMPGATDMIKMMLDEEIAYRMLSGVAHGHSWAIIGLGFKAASDVIIGGALAKGFEKTDNLNGIMYLGLLTMKALARPLWNQCHYFGWDALRLEEIFENAADAVCALPSVRFWRN